MNKYFLQIMPFYLNCMLLGLMNWKANTNLNIFHFISKMIFVFQYITPVNLIHFDDLSNTCRTKTRIIIDQNLSTGTIFEQKFLFTTFLKR